MKVDEFEKNRRQYLSDLSDEISVNVNSDKNINIEDNDLFNLGLVISEDKSKKPDSTKVIKKIYNSPYELLEIDGIKKLQSYLNEDTKAIYRAYIKCLPDFNWNDYVYNNIPKFIRAFLNNTIFWFSFLSKIDFNLIDYINGKDYGDKNNIGILSEEYVSGCLNSTEKDKYVEAIRKVFSEAGYHKYISDVLIRGILISNNQDAINILIDVFKNSNLSEGLRVLILNHLYGSSYETHKKFFRVIQDEGFLRFSSVKEYFLLSTRINIVFSSDVREYKELEKVGDYILDCSLNNKTLEYLQTDNPLKVYSALYVREEEFKDSCEYIYNNYASCSAAVKVAMIRFVEYYLDRKFYKSTYGVNRYFILHLLKNESDPILIANVFCMFNYRPDYYYKYFILKPVEDKEDLLLTIIDKYIPIIKSQGKLKVYRFKGPELEVRSKGKYDDLKIYSMILGLVDELNLYYDRVYEYSLFEKSIGIYSNYSDISNYTNPYVRSAMMKACLSSVKDLRDHFCWKVPQVLDLTFDDYLYLSSGFSSKKSDLRQNISEIMKMCDDNTLVEVINKLLADKKVQNRDAALSLIKDNNDRFEKPSKQLANDFEKIKIVISKSAFSKEMEDDKNNIIADLGNEEDYDFYDENYDVEIPKPVYDAEVLKEFLDIDYTYSKHDNNTDKNSNRYINLIKEFYQIIIDNDGKAVEMYDYGEVFERTIGEEVKNVRLNHIAKYQYQIDDIKKFEEVKNSYVLGDEVMKKIGLIDKTDLLTLKIITDLIGKFISSGGIDKNRVAYVNKLSAEGKFPSLAHTLKDLNEIDYYEFINFKHSFKLIEYYYVLEENFDVTKEYNQYFLNYYMYLLSVARPKVMNPTDNKDTNGLFFNNLRLKRENKEEISCEYCKLTVENSYNEDILKWAFSDVNAFFDDKFAFIVFINNMSIRPIGKMPMSAVLYFISKGFIKKDFLYRLLLDSDEFDVRRNFKDSCKRSSERYEPLNSERYLLNKLYTYLKSDFKSDEDRESDIFKVGSEILSNTVNYVVDVESKRSEIDTEYTERLMLLKGFPGVDNFAKILFKMGDLKFVRGYNWEATGKTNVFSYIVGNSEPEIGLTQEQFNSALDKYDISRAKLIEAGMYNIRYIGFIENYLDIDGLSELAYYFKYHTTHEYFLYSDEDKKIVKRYSDISPNDLMDGQMDIEWFKRAYKRVGKKNYEQIYDAVKYITSGSLHKRAQYFADAVLGKLKVSEVEERIFKSRNLNMVLAYGLIPLKGKKDNAALKRYINIQEFQKGSKEFGGKKRSNEKLAIEISLNNLAKNYGVSRDRFNWLMEVLLIDSFGKAFSPQKVDDIEVHISLDKPATPAFIVTKNGKTLKSVPAKLKKNEVIVELNEIKKELKGQYSRCRKALETAMTDEDVFTFEELQGLYKHPVINTIVKDILFTCSDKVGFVVGNKLVSYDGEFDLAKGDELTITHPVHLVELKTWSKWQDYIISEQIKQPFKQVFREIYVMTDDERSNDGFTNRFAGYQVDPKRTRALLASRNWIINGYDGFEKVSHKHNVLIDLYAYNDWSVTSALEAPSLDELVFLDNTTHSPMKMNDVSSVLFSEIMRDMDLVVSVAYVGGVDPLINTSTIEMRRKILEHNLSLFKITNYSIDNNHVFIDGDINRYSIHLGSGVVHIKDKGMLPIFPVHSAQRGKVFLPFVDEDPKTSEIITLALVLAKDTKIKDPSIIKYL